MTTFLKATLIALSMTTAAHAADLTLTPYNPGTDGTFPVTSTVIEGPTEVMLIDAQFEKDDAQALLEIIQATGKPLNTIYISAGDPDFYFGLDVIKAAYPDARVLATAETVKHISDSAEGKLAFWGPILGANAPSQVIIPDVIDATELKVDGAVVQITGPDVARNFLWVPSVKTVLGGVALSENQHVWMADTQTPESRQSWRATLDAMLALQPERFIAGHTLGKSSEGADIAEFTRSYVMAFEAEAEKAGNSAALITAMQALYPAFPADRGLEISAKVIKGEMTWPQ